MFCSKCGKEITGGNKFCAGCGTPVEAESTVNEETVQTSEPVYAQMCTPTSPVIVVKKSKKPIIIGIAAGILALIIVIVSAFLISGNMGKKKLQKELLKDWERVENSGKTYYTLVLDFDDDEIDYLFDSTYVDKEIASYDYKVVSSDEIYVEELRKTIKIKFNKDKTMMTFTPALTSTEKSENWFNLD